jgi:hypothetical protein
MPTFRRLSLRRAVTLFEEESLFPISQLNFVVTRRSIKPAHLRRVSSGREYRVFRGCSTYIKFTLPAREKPEDIAKNS